MSESDVYGVVPLTYLAKYDDDKLDAPPPVGISSPWFKKFGVLRSVARLVLTASGTGSLLVGFNISLLNTCIATIGADFGWCSVSANGVTIVVPGWSGCSEFKLRAAFVQTAVFIGAFIGALSAGKLLRRGCLTAINVAMLSALLGIAFSIFTTSFATLFMSRVVVGIGVGLLSVTVPTYIAEMTPKKFRGSYGVMHQQMITVGILIGVLLGLPLSRQPTARDDVSQPTPEQYAWRLRTFDWYWWRAMLGFGLIPVVLATLAFNFLYTMETPYYYIRNGQIDEAKKLLQKLNEKSDVTAEVEDIQLQLVVAAQARPFKKVVADKLAMYVIAVGCLIAAFQSFSGINAFITSSNKLFAQAGLEAKLVTEMSVVLTLVNCLITLPATWLIEKLGRRLLLLIGVAGMAASVLPGMVMLWALPTSMASTWVAIAGAILFTVFFAASYGPVLWVWLFEIFPTDIKDTGAGIATGVNWISTAITVFAASYMNTRVAYSVFFALCVVGLIGIALTMKETKGRALGDSPYYSKHSKGAQPSTKVSADDSV